MQPAELLGYFDLCSLPRWKEYTNHIKLVVAVHCGTVCLSPRKELGPQFLLLRLQNMFQNNKLHGF